MARLLTLVAAASVVMALGVCPAAAQESGGGYGSNRPFSGLFGGAEPLSSRGQMLSLTLSGFGGWDDAPAGLTAPVEGTDDDRVYLSGVFGGGTATLNYTRTAGRLALGAYGTTFVGYFPSSRSWYDSQSGGANASASFDLSPRTTLRIGQQATFATEYRVGYQQGEISDVPLASGDNAFDNSLERDPSVYLTTDVDYTYEVSQKSTFSLFYGYRTRQFLQGDSPRAGLHDHGAGARFQRMFGRYAGMRLGYSYRRALVDFQPAQEGEAEPDSFGFHDIDAGLTYARSLSLTRKTTLAFTTGSTVAASASGGSEDPVVPDDEEPGLFGDARFFVVGSATLSRELARSWSARAAYSRSVNYSEGFRTPSLLDTAAVSIGGLMTKRFDFTAGAFYSTAAVGLEDRNYSSWVASTQLRAAVTRNLAAFISYYRFNYRFDDGIEIPGNLPRRVNRQGIRFGLTTWVPLWSTRGTQ